MIRSFFIICIVLSFFPKLDAQITIENIYFTSGAEVAVEGCPDTIVIELNARVLNDTLAYNVVRGGDASPDDYSTTIGDTIYFRNNDIRLLFPIDHIADGIMEGSETLSFSFVNRETGDFAPFSYLIYDEMPLDITAAADTLCLFNPVLLTGEGAGIYSWLSGDSSVLHEGKVFEYFPRNRDTIFLRGRIHDCVKDTFRVFEFYDDFLSINQDDTVFICKPDSATLTVQANNGEVTWSSDIPGILSTTSGRSVVVSTDTSSYVYARLEGENCVIYDTVYVRVDSLPEFYFLENTPTPDSPCTSYCPGQLVTLTLNTTDPILYPDAEFEWMPNRGIQEGEMDQNVLIQTEPDTFYYVRITRNNACMSRDSILIPTIDTTIQLNLRDTSVCRSEPAQEIQINILNNPDRLTDIEWMPDDGSLSCTDCLNPVITATETKTYTVMATVDGCCPSTASVMVEVTTGPLPIANVNTCPGDPVNIIVDDMGLMNPEWIGNNTNLLDCTSCFNNTATVQADTRFLLRAEDEDGCIHIGSVLVDVYNPAVNITISTDPGQEIGIGGTVLLDVTTTPEIPDTNQIFYELNGERLEVSGPTVEIEILQEGENTIDVIVIDNNGCEVVETIIINGVPPDIEMPNAFTPDNDQINDVFRPVITNAEQANALIEEFRIYNRWGEMVYQYSPNDQIQGWDGRYEGDLAPPDVYMYQIVLRLPNGELETLNGDVTLIR